ncbi:NADH-quinone oxidoreductase subunit F [Thiorhodococcus mannitoliphagus]|uniref:NADH-quinone oxidoreductase subunit F n=1 Tax=Thiorhodococcus mannitoliphagus TaxID=329406 RepID=A0A6P1DQ62_9GAMM|nr:NADH-ubiquinone oxidoreductase-F iron-sulfur binding region domain-containing protein [Thiorhodococcus mannitoliphagus]NEX18796.1 NADH-quinone oxidoreductase subunit F [Thiorhodococcus mannitoliphagus]
MDKAPVLNQVLLQPSSRVGADFDAWLWDVGGSGLEAALQEPGRIVDMVKEADLRGLGGSGFPTWVKWSAVAKQTGEKYLICNGNEDEPGTFKDRVLMEECPHQLIEGATIAAVACGIQRVVFYINPHLSGAIDAVRRALHQWQQSEWPERIAQATGVAIDYRVQPSSGHYIGGEETAAIESVEGKFPFPRAKPPYPTEHGVHGRPTLINNVETLSNLPHLLRNGVEWFRRQGLGEATGTKIYSLSGDVLRPGVYELPMGTPLSDLLYHYGEGMLVGKKLKAVFTGGPSNTILTPKDIDVPMDFESVAARRSALGTGAMIAVSQGTGIVKKVGEYVSFFASSSCGQCPSCKTGTYYMSQLLNRIGTGQGTRSDLDSLINLCKILPGSGRCHLVNGAVKVLDSSLYHFMDEYEQSLRGAPT